MAKYLRCNIRLRLQRNDAVDTIFYDVSCSVLVKLYSKKFSANLLGVFLEKQQIGIKAFIDETHVRILPEE